MNARVYRSDPASGRPRLVGPRLRLVATTALAVLALAEQVTHPVVPTVATESGPSPARRLPAWLKRPIPAAGGMYFTKNLIGELGLETICESARCPNRSECWTRRTATFMILGEVCTRPCGFCAVKTGALSRRRG